MPPKKRVLITRRKNQRKIKAAQENGENQDSSIPLSSHIGANNVTSYPSTNEKKLELEIAYKTAIYQPSFQDCSDKASSRIIQPQAESAGFWFLVIDNIEVSGDQQLAGFSSNQENQHGSTVQSHTALKQSAECSQQVINVTSPCCEYPSTSSNEDQQTVHQSLQSSNPSISCEEKLCGEQSPIFLSENMKTLNIATPSLMLSSQHPHPGVPASQTCAGVNITTNSDLYVKQNKSTTTSRKKQRPSQSPQKSSFRFILPRPRIITYERKRPLPEPTNLQFLQPAMLLTGNKDSDSHYATQASGANSFKFPLSVQKATEQNNNSGINGGTQSTDLCCLKSSIHLNNIGSSAQSPGQSHSGFNPSDPHMCGQSSVVDNPSLSLPPLELNNGYNLFDHSSTSTGISINYNSDLCVEQKKTTKKPRKQQFASQSPNKKFQRPVIGCQVLLPHRITYERKRPLPESAHFQSLQPEVLLTGKVSYPRYTTQTSGGNYFKFPLSSQSEMTQNNRSGINGVTQSTARLGVQSKTPSLNNFAAKAQSTGQSHTGFNPQMCGQSKFVDNPSSPPLPLLTLNNQIEAELIPSRSDDYLNGDVESSNCVEKSLQVQEATVSHHYSELQPTNNAEETQKCRSNQTELHVFRQQQVYYESRPQDHPRYPAEWQSFCERHMELKSQGKSFSKPELKLDWIAFWKRRLKEMNHQEVVQNSKSSSYQHSQQLNAIEFHSLSFYNQHLDPRRNRTDQGKQALQPRTLLSDQLQDPILIPIIPQQ